MIRTTLPSAALCALFALGCESGSDETHASLTCIDATTPSSVPDAYNGSPVYPLVAGTVASPPSGTTVTAPNGVLANDSASCNGTNTITINSPPLHGTLSIESDGDFVYTPSIGPSIVACGDRFHYHLTGPFLSGNEVEASIAYGTCPFQQWTLREIYIYQGCLDPRTNPWDTTPTFTTPVSSQPVEVDLRTDVSLRVEVTSQPSNGRVVTSGYGFVFTPSGSGASSGRVGLRISDGACVYNATANLNVLR